MCKEERGGAEGQGEEEDAEKGDRIIRAISLNRQMGMGSGTPGGKTGLCQRSGWFTCHNWREARIHELDTEGWENAEVFFQTFLFSIK